jgi:hypothetical protein
LPAFVFERPKGDGRLSTWVARGNRSELPYFPNSIHEPSTLENYVDAVLIPALK